METRRERVLKKLKLSDNMMSHRPPIRLIDATLKELEKTKVIIVVRDGVVTGACSNDESIQVEVLDLAVP